METDVLKYKGPWLPRLRVLVSQEVRGWVGGNAPPLNIQCSLYCMANTLPATCPKKFGITEAKRGPLDSFIVTFIDQTRPKQSSKLTCGH